MIEDSTRVTNEIIEKLRNLQSECHQNHNKVNPEDKDGMAKVLIPLIENFHSIFESLDELNVIEGKPLIR